MPGKLKFVKRGGALAATLAEDDLAAHEWGQDVPDPLPMVRAQELDLPIEVDIVYINPAQDYQQSVQRSQRMTGSSKAVVSVPLPIVLTDAKAKQAADVGLFNLWSSRTTFSLALSRKWSKLEPTDVIDVPNGNLLHRMRIVKKDDSKPGLLKLEAVFEDSAIYSQSGAAVGSGTIPVQTLSIPSPTILEFLDIPLLRDMDDDAGFYVAVCGQRSNWFGCVIYKSLDGGQSYSELITLIQPSTMGSTTTALGNFTGGNIFDELNSVTVQLLNGSLASATELEVLNGANAAVIGNELIQFKTATLIAANTYLLSGLLRGRKGTEWNMATHAIGNRFVLVSKLAWRRIAASSAEIGLQRMYKAVSFGMTLQKAAGKPFTNGAEGLECYSVVEVGAGGVATNDVTFIWKRRSRISGEWRDYADAPIGEASESYEIEIWDGATYTTLRRTLVSATLSAAYTAAQQTTDFGATQSIFYIRIFQLSATVGRGRVTQAALSPKMKEVAFSTQWRVYITTAVSISTSLAEIEMRAFIGTIDQCNGGTASASTDGNGVSANAFDNNTTTKWGSNTNTADRWIQYTFLTAVSVQELMMTAHEVFSNQALVSFSLQYYNGAIWVATLIVSNEPAWSNYETRVYS